jgi:hypothetical protein
MKIAIILGAGASASEGAPLQSSLFKDYFRSVRHLQTNGDRMIQDLASFFQLIFNIDVFAENAANSQFPTFEEVLGILELAERRRESIKYFDLDNIQRRFSYLRVIRQYLVLLMAKVIHDGLQSSVGHHKQLVHNLADSGMLKDTVFMSTNYDILIDNALVNLFPMYSLDYGVDFTNFKKQNDWKRPTKRAISLFKVHGSLNWLYCPTCNTLTLTPKEKGVIRVLTEGTTCSRCDSVIVPIIVPPTYYKDMSNAFLNMIWHQSEQSLLSVDHVFICGYSFPDADMHLKYLLKRIQTNRTGVLSFTVFNHHVGKSAQQSADERQRFLRFLGPSVDFTNKSFEDFAINPKKYLPPEHRHITRHTTSRTHLVRRS